MKILLASTPGTGHLNPMLAIGGFLIDAGHDVAILTTSTSRNRVERIGAKFYSLFGAADRNPRDLVSGDVLKNIPPGLQWLRVAMERVFVDTIPDQHASLERALQDFRADVIVGDDMLYGVIPMLLGPRSKRPPVILCGTSILHWPRSDGAPNFVGLLPATTPAQREEYASIAREHDEVLYEPLTFALNNTLKTLGIGPVSGNMVELVVELADAFIQLSVPSFEYPRDVPAPVTFVGALPIIPNQVPLPPWAAELDGSRKVVLVTQGTVANHDFNLLVAPTLAALASEPDVLVVVTAGGRAVEELPGPIPANVRAASYLPFEWLLPKVDVFVTNGGYGSVNQAMSYGIPLVTAGLTEDKADVNARVAWSGVGINLETNNPTPQAIREAVRSVLDRSDYRSRASAMADDFRAIDTRSEILRIVNQVSQRSNKPELRLGGTRVAKQERRVAAKA
jgi:MGT family glycosyltransferase